MDGRKRRHNKRNGVRNRPVEDGELRRKGDLTLPRNIIIKHNITDGDFYVQCSPKDANIAKALLEDVMKQAKEYREQQSTWVAAHYQDLKKLKDIDEEAIEKLPGGMYG